jgi:hypothetical protein
VCQMSSGRRKSSSQQNRIVFGRISALMIK